MFNVAGYSNIYRDAKVGRDYYITCSPTTETQPRLTPNNSGCPGVIGVLGNARYYGTAIKDGIIHINGYSK